MVYNKEEFIIEKSEEYFQNHFKENENEREDENEKEEEERKIKEEEERKIREEEERKIKEEEERKIREEEEVGQWKTEVNPWGRDFGVKETNQPTSDENSIWKYFIDKRKKDFISSNYLIWEWDQDNVSIKERRYQILTYILLFNKSVIQNSQNQNIMKWTLTINQKQENPKIISFFSFFLIIRISFFLCDCEVLSFLILLFLDKEKIKQQIKKIK